MNPRKIASAVAGILLCLCAYCQGTGGEEAIFGKARSDYEIGRFDETISLLEGNIDNLSGEYREGAYRLLSLSYLALDNRDEAERYARLMLKDNPYYNTTMQDPPRFSDIVRTLKAGMTATITTASSQAEGIEESPVPITLITREMIEDCGGRNLKEVLLAYVPGMTDIDNNGDLNVAMRGVFSSGQEKMLLLLNGHRLNNYATNTGSPDYSISLDKIKQIEVLRGPASSLYGGVALTAVINIITLDGRDIDGARLKIGAGSYGQFKTDFTFGKSYYDLNIMAWASLYRSDGQTYSIDASDTGLGAFGGEYTVGAFKGGPSYDIGVTVGWKALSLMYNSRYSKVVPSLSAGYSFAPYDYEAYTTFHGDRIGMGTKTHHTELSYNNTFGKWDVGVSLFYDVADLMHYQVLSDQAFPYLGSIMGLGSAYNEVLGVDGVFRYNDGQENNIGGLAKADFNYIDNGTHRGTLSFGMHYNLFELEDLRYLIGTNYEKIIMEPSALKKEGKGEETSNDAYIQVKHKWNRWVFNVGLRYDYKEHSDGDKISEFSPRAAIVYVAPKWNAKVNYSRSFVDAPYFYRKTNELLGKYLVQDTTIPDLLPESLNSWQASFGSNSLVQNLSFEVNWFFNSAKNLIYSNGLLHANSASGKNTGVELTADYLREKFKAHFTFTWQKMLEIDYNLDIDDFQPNVPYVSSNLVLSYQVLRPLRVYTHINFYGKQDTFWVRPLEDPRVTFGTNKARAIVNLGATYDWKRFTFGFDIHNLLNTNYTQGGLTAGNIRQQGIWVLGSVAVKI